MIIVIQKGGFPGDSVIKNMPANTGDIRDVGLIPVGMATHSSILAWRIPRTEEPGGLQSTGSHRVGLRLMRLSMPMNLEMGSNCQRSR